jgi:hypothetical protein
MIILTYIIYKIMMQIDISLKQQIKDYANKSAIEIILIICKLNKIEINFLIFSI